MIAPIIIILKFILFEKKYINRENEMHENITDPTAPEIVFFVLIFVNFGPPAKLPIT